jgi:putative copper export protein
MLRTILLVVVVVLVLDLLWGVNRSARVTPAARFGRSLSLPRLERRSMLRAILLVVVLVLDLLSGGQP